MFTTSTTTRPVAAFSSTPVTGKALVAAAHSGTVQFYKVRANGTFRHWPVLAPSTPARKQAESWAKAATAKGGVTGAAAKANVSVATFRRALVALAFTVELEGAKAAELAAAAKGITPKPETAVKAPAKAAPKAPKGKPAKAEVRVSTAKISEALGDLIAPKPMSIKAKADAHAAKNSTVGNAVKAAKAKAAK